MQTVAPPNLSEDELATLIRGAQPPEGLLPLGVLALLAGGSFASISAFLGTVLAWAMVTMTGGEQTLIPTYIPVGALFLSLVAGPVALKDQRRRWSFRACKAALEVRRARDERLRVVGALSEALRQRLGDDDETRERLTRIEARLCLLVEDETRVLSSMEHLADQGASSEAATSAALSSEIDRLIAGVSSLHAAVVSPGAAPGALDWLEAEAELALPARPRVARTER